MSVLSQLISRIPGLDDYNDQVRANSAQSMQGVQQASGLMGIMNQFAAQQQKQQAAQRDAQMRGAISGLSPDASQEDVMRAVRPYASADDLLKSATSSADNRERAKDRAFQWSQTLDLKKETEERKREEFMSKTEDTRLRNAFEQQHKTRMLEINEAQNAARNELARLGLDVRQQGINIQGQIATTAKRPIVERGEDGTVRFYDNYGNLVKDLGRVGTPSAQYQKTEQQKRQLSMDLTRTIGELEKATADGGLIDQSTGSGAGALVDSAAGFFGKATPGAIAAGQTAPIFDLVLKMVPRFEGPQSDKDVASYERAAGQLANPAVPNPQKKAAGKEILRLMKARKGQFVSRDMVGTEAPAPSGPKFLGFE